ncbi:MAG: glycosyltransferase family 1 protein [Candidatus Sulfotelmatobacter sp.]
MIHLFINALSASAGGGLTYVRNVLPCLANRDDVRTTLLVGEMLRGEMVESTRVTVLNGSYNGGSARRFWHEQRDLPGLIRRSGADVLLSTGNFALFRSPVPQILLSRNALYTSADFLCDIRQRGDYRLWIDTKVKGGLARWSVYHADCTVAPSEAFAGDLRQWTGKDVMSIHHGFDRDTFFCAAVPLPQEVQNRVDALEGSVRILFVSHYNYYRNFETLIRAVGILKAKLHPQPVRLVLTCKLASKENPGSYQAEIAADLVRLLDLGKEVVELGTVPYEALHHLYERCDVYATPAYAETFAHPLVEAMASRLPVIASDLAVHREICGDAALYFPRFSPKALAERILQVVESGKQRASMQKAGLVRSLSFNWDNHVEALLVLARRLVARDRRGFT